MTIPVAMARRVNCGCVESGAGNVFEETGEFIKPNRVMRKIRNGFRLMLTHHRILELSAREKRRFSH